MCGITIETRIGPHIHLSFVKWWGDGKRIVWLAHPSLDQTVSIHQTHSPPPPAPPPPPKKRGDTHLSSFFLRLLKRTWGDCERLRKTANESRTICIITWAGVCGCSFAAPTYSLHQCCNCFLYERLSDCAAWIVYRCGASITRNKRRGKKKTGFFLGAFVYTDG